MLRSHSLILVVVLTLGTALFANAASVIVSPSTATEIPAGGFDAPWSAPITNAIGSDDARTQATDTAAGTYILVLSGFDFSSIPLGATIDGIEVAVEGQHNDSVAAGFAVNATTAVSPSEVDFQEFMAVTNISTSAAGASDSIFVIGTPTDPWASGTSPAIARSDLLNTNFAIGVQSTSSGGAIFQIDDVQVTVYFNSGAPATPSSSLLTVIGAVFALTLFGFVGAWRLSESIATKST